MAEEKSVQGEKVLTAEQKRLIAKVQSMLPEAKLFEPKADGKYYGSVLFADKSHLVQQVGDNTVVVHDRKHLGELPLDQDKGARALAKLNGAVIDVNYKGLDGAVAHANQERWLERTARTPAVEPFASIAKAHLGQGVSVYDPPGAAAKLSPAYEGVVVASTENHLIQRINSRTAYVHNVGAELAKQFGAGQHVAITYENGALKRVEAIEKERTRGREAPERDTPKRSLDPEAARKNSFHFARNIIKGTYGADVKFYDPAKLGQDPSFKGTLVAVTDHHVMQRIASNKFVAHQRENLDGEIHRGKFTQVAYTNGRGLVTEHDVRRDRAPAPERPRSQGQGMSR